MNITATLIGQVVTFLILVWFIKRFLWGPLIQMLEDRRQRIADGLAAGERGRHEQELAEKRAAERLHEAKQQAQEIIAQAERRATEIVEEAKNQARKEGERLLEAAQAEIEQEVNRAREGLRGQVVSLAVAGAGRVLKREIDAKAHDELLNELVGNL